MKNKSTTLLVLGFLLAIVTGLLIGHYLMPVEKVVASKCAEIPDCNIPTCPVCEDKTTIVKEKCELPSSSYELDKLQREQKQEADKAQVFLMYSTRNCDDYANNAGIFGKSLPVCLQSRQIVDLENTSKGCTITYKVGFC